MKFLPYLCTRNQETTSINNKKVKELLAANKDAAAFTEALKTAYPELPGDADALAQSLYKK